MVKNDAKTDLMKSSDNFNAQQTQQNVSYQRPARASKFSSLMNSQRAPDSKKVSITEPPKEESKEVNISFSKNINSSSDVTGRQTL